MTKKIILSVLVLAIFAMPALAVQPYSRQIVQEESYEGSSATGFNSQYAHNTTAYAGSNAGVYYNQNQNFNNNYVPVNNNGYYYNDPNYIKPVEERPYYNNPVNYPNVCNQQPIQAGVQKTAAPTPAGYVYNSKTNAATNAVFTPKSYNKKIVTTEVVKDERETIDKVLDRTGKVVGMLGVAGLVTTAIIGVSR